MKTSLITWLLAMTAAITAVSAQPPPRRDDRRPVLVPPVFAALDTDRDQVLSATEIEQASDILEAFDKNKDGEITLEEFHRPQSSGNGPRKNERKPDKPQNGKPPVPPVIAALDTDRDGFISAGEIEDAAESLKKLDKNDDGSLSPEELRPHGPPPGQRPHGPPPQDEAEIE